MKILAKNPDDRLSAREALNHSWFSQDREALMEAIILNDYLSNKL